MSEKTEEVEIGDLVVPFGGQHLSQGRWGIGVVTGLQLMESVLDELDSYMVASVYWSKTQNETAFYTGNLEVVSKRADNRRACED